MCLCVCVFTKAILLHIYYMYTATVLRSSVWMICVSESWLLRWGRTSIRSVRQPLTDRFTWSSTPLMSICPWWEQTFIISLELCIHRMNCLQWFYKGSWLTVLLSRGIILTGMTSLCPTLPSFSTSSLRRSENMRRSWWVCRTKEEDGSTCRTSRYGTALSL